MNCPSAPSLFKGLLSLSLLVNSLAAMAEDWPQWRGPGRDGLSKETGLLKEWPKEGPRLAWQVKDLGEGFSSPSIVAGRLYLISNNGAEDEFVQAREARDGKILWTTSIGKVGPNTPQMNYGGSRSTPTIDGDAMYVLGSDGDLARLDVSSGKISWKKNIRAEFGGKPGQWAYAESPLVDGRLVICTPGGGDATMVALDKKTGELAWKSPMPEADEAGYSSAIAVEVGGVRQYVQLLGKGLVGVDARSGKFLWRYNKPVSRFGANIPSPTAADGYVYAAAAGTGGGAAKLSIKDGTVVAESAYFESKLPTAIGGVVKVGDFLYGTTGQAMICANFKTGEIKWEERALGAGSICVADGRIFLHAESGEIALIQATSEGYREKGRIMPPDAPKHSRPMQKAWTYPALSNGRLYIRDLGSLWCYEVK